jgi:hypothetical protein
MALDGNYTVAANRLNLRTRPTADSDVAAVLTLGSVVQVLHDVDEQWWEIAMPGQSGTGFVQRRHLAPLSVGVLPALPGVHQALLDATESAKLRGVKYGFGAKSSFSGRIDCSGWVSEMTRSAFNAVNALANPEIVFDAADHEAMKTHSDGIITGIERRTGHVLHGTEVRLESLREGMVVGVDFGIHEWESDVPPRVYNIDHIVQLVADGAGVLQVSQSSNSGNGVNTLALTAWLEELGKRGLIAAGRVHAADPFTMADRNTSFVRTLLLPNAPVPGSPLPPQPDSPLLARIGLAGQSFDIEPQPAEPEFTADSLEDVLLASATKSGCRIIVSSAAGAAPYEVYRWFPQSLPARLPLTAEVATLRGVQAIILEAQIPVVYFPAEEPTSKRWVAVPWTHEFYRLPTALRENVKAELLRRVISRVGSADAPALQALALPLLRLWIARHVDAVLPVKDVNQSADGFRGSRTSGVTLPFFSFPLSEPACYLPVIAGREGLMESVNGYDLGAGISVGPIQFNVHGGALFRFLWNLLDQDPYLFERELGAPLGWTIRSTGSGTWELRSSSASLNSHSSQEAANAAFLQSGSKTAGAFSDIDVALRKRLTERFRNIVTWPHVQALLTDTSAWWMQSGLTIINANGIPPLVPFAPVRDTFVLRALLMSAHVRYTGYTQPIAKALAAWPDSATKLGNLIPSLDTAVLNKHHRQTLQKRLEEQKNEANAVFDVVEQLMTAWV